MRELLKSYKGCAKMQPLVAEMVPRSFCACSDGEPSVSDRLPHTDLELVHGKMVYRADLCSSFFRSWRLCLWDAREAVE